MMGAVLQTVNVRLPLAQIGYTLKHARAEIILCHPDFLPLLEALVPDLNGIRAVIVLDDNEPSSLPNFAAAAYEPLLAVSDPDFPFEDFDGNAVATTFYTSGTTGDPKGVQYTHRQIVLLALASKAPFGVTRDRRFGADDVYMPLTPMFHVHAWCLPYVATMMGVKQVYPGRYDANLICHLRTHEKVSYSHCVPTILQMILTAAAETNTDLSGWAMTIGGSALTEALWEEAYRRGMHVHVGYGMSETGPMLTNSRRLDGDSPVSERDGAALTMAGVVIPLVSLRIVDEDMRELPHNGVARGELVARAPWLTPCYTGNPEASVELWRGGWLHTQDVATIDPKGRISICDRLKDVIKTGGEWIASLELENVIASDDAVAEVAVIGVPDARWGERPIAVIVAATGAQPTLEIINAALDVAIQSGTLSRYARLDRIEVVQNLPRTSVGKIDKKAIRKQIAKPR